MTKETTRHDFGGSFHIDFNGSKIYNYFDETSKSKPSDMKLSKLNELYKEKERAAKIKDEEKRKEIIAEIENRILRIKEYMV